jgi:hypothetical protein
MMGYGLPEGKQGLLPWKWAEQRLKQSHNYWITTVKPDGAPHTMVVWDRGWMALSCSAPTAVTQSQNLSENQNCVVCTEHA